MQDQGEATAERKPGRGFWGLALWTGVIVLLYILSWGPFVMMEQKGVLRSTPALHRLGEILYSPLAWAYANTPLRKPLRMYLHLWCPQLYPANEKSNWIDGTDARF